MRRIVIIYSVGGVGSHQINDKMSSLKLVVKVLDHVTHYGVSVRAVKVV